MNTFQKLLMLPMLALLGIGLLLYEPQARAATFVVNPAGGGDFTTIAAAVSAANPLGGDVIQVVGGTNTESNITLDRPITLQGAQFGVDARTRGPDGVPGGETVMVSNGRIFNLNSAGIVIDGFMFPDIGLRGFDSFANPDDLVIRNNIFLTTYGNCSGGGNIQFGGGGSPLYHANNFLFEQNFVIENTSNGCGYFLYNGHQMDGGTIRNNYIQSRYFAFGPFGDRAGWVLEGNEFDGRMLYGTPAVLTPYRGAGFNANLGDVQVRNNHIHHMRNGIGSISVVGGSIRGNVFEDNGFSIGLWGGEWGSVVSSNVVIENNRFTYNGRDCTSASDAAHGIWLRPPTDPNYPGQDPGNPSFPNGIDASSVHIRYNCFIDLAVGTCGQAWAIRQDGTNTLDAEMNWWGSTNSVVIASMIGEGAAEYTPFLTDIQYTGTSSFGTLEEVILQATLNGSSGPVAGATISFHVDGSLVGSAVTDTNGLAVYNWGAQSAGSYGVTATMASGCFASTEATITVSVPQSPTTLTYTGPWLAIANGSVTLRGTLWSEDPACIAGQSVDFYVDNVLAGSSTVGLDGGVTLPVSLSLGVHEVELAFGGSSGCAPSLSETSFVTVATLGDQVYGGGWYKPTTSPTTRASFGFVARAKTNRRSGVTLVSGQLVWTYHKNYQLKSVSVTQLGYTTINGYAKSAVLGGQGELRTWDPETQTWTDPQLVDFVATVSDGGTSVVRKRPVEKPDAFGMYIPGVYRDPNIPTVLSGGNIKVNGAK